METLWKRSQEIEPADTVDFLQYLEAPEQYAEIVWFCEMKEHVQPGLDLFGVAAVVAAVDVVVDVVVDAVVVVVGVVVVVVVTPDTLLRRTLHHLVPQADCWQVLAVCAGVGEIA